MNEKLLNLLNKGSESKGFDYKGRVSWQEAKLELTKDILAMSNIQYGGVIVIGMSENRVTGLFEPEGLPGEWVADYDVTKVSDFVNKYADPRVSIEVKPASYQGKTFVFIFVKEFEEIPIICRKDAVDVLKAGETYIRTDSATSVPISSLGDRRVEEMRKLLDLALRKKRDNLLETIRGMVDMAPRTEDKVSSEKYKDERADIERDFK